MNVKRSRQTELQRVVFCLLSNAWLFLTWSPSSKTFDESKDIPQKSISFECANLIETTMETINSFQTFETCLGVNFWVLSLTIIKQHEMHWWWYEECDMCWGQCYQVTVEPHILIRSAVLPPPRQRCVTWSLKYHSILCWGHLVKILYNLHTKLSQLQNIPIFFNV